MNTEITGKIIVVGDNIDTDQIYPGRFLAITDPKEIGSHCLCGVSEDIAPNFPEGGIVVAGRNFGCGSSREHAPWALLDFGIRCIISEDFADIFYNNCFKNGILPIKVSKEVIAKLMDDASRGSNAVIEIDLEKQEIKGPDGGTVHFEVDAFRKHCLLNGAITDPRPYLD